MPAKFYLNADQVAELKQMIADCVLQSEVAKHFNTTDAMIRKYCKENNIEAQWLRLFTCVECGNEFKAKYKALVCPDCKLKPAICIICGSEFEKKHPYTQKTCSPKCRGIYRKQSGIAKAGAVKMLETKIDRYGTLDPAEVTKQRNGSGQLPSKVCPLCNEEFIPNTPRQVYCTDIHYGPCPVCGKPVQIKDNSIGPQACSESCRQKRIQQTSIERYGVSNPGNSKQGREKARQTSLKNFGSEYYMQSEEGKANFRNKMQQNHGVSNPQHSPELRKKLKQTNLIKYGVEHPMQSEEVKSQAKKTMQERYGGYTLEPDSTLNAKFKATMKERYDVDYPMQSNEIKEKTKAANLAKYGTEHAMRSEEANRKRNQTNLIRYGAENVYGSKQIQDKIRKLWTEKYGGPNPMYSKELRALAQERMQATMQERYGAKSSVNVPEIKQKISATMQERYGVDWYVESPECMEHNYHAISRPNKRFAECLNELGVETSFEYYIGRPSFDLHIKNSNILIEIDPTWSHNSFDNNWHEPKEKNYHLKKTQLAEENGMRCIHIFDWDNVESIIGMLLPKRKIFARKCEIRQLDRKTAEIFTSQHHLQGSCKGQNIAYGLFYQGELMQIMTFGKPRYTQKYDLELLRLCTQTGIEVVGGASRLFKQFLKDYPDKSVLSYCDSAKFSGSVYTQMGMKLSHVTPPAKVWSKDDKYITDNYLRQRGFDQIFKADYGKGTSNEELMLEHGWLPVYDCGQKVFIYTK